MKAMALVFSGLLTLPAFCWATNPCDLKTRVQLLIDTIQSRESIACESDATLESLVCHPSSGNVVLDLIPNKKELTAEGYWSSAQATVWVSIHITTKAQNKSCLVEDYSFDAAVED